MGVDIMGRFEIEDFVNILNLGAEPKEIIYEDEVHSNKYNNFSDLGAWHGYYLPKEGSKELYGSFPGPVIIAEEYPFNLSSAISKINIYNENSEAWYNLSDGEIEFKYYPGRLFQSYKLADLELYLNLIFVSNRSALIETKIRNCTKEELKLKIKWTGSIFNGLREKEEESSYGLNQSLGISEKGIQVRFSKVREPYKFFSSEEASFHINFNEDVCSKVNGNAYSAMIKNNIAISTGGEYKNYSVQSYVFTERELNKELTKNEEVLRNPKKYFEHNKTRWQGYLSNALAGNQELPLKHKRAIVKTVETLVTNWRSSAGAILHDGVVPTMTYKWFIGLWAWDSWKHAAAVARFNGELAKSNIEALFDYQIESSDKIRPKDSGAICDAIFFNKDNSRGGDGENWNERNSKPPLAAWAVWMTYKVTEDKEFLRTMYPQLKVYHQWWYNNRDHDKNGIAEYGAMVHEKNNSDKQVILAAAWESGMDNAPRFDVSGYGAEDIGVKVFENKNDNGQIIGYSINQESVDLNSYLYAEKVILKDIAKILGYEEEAIKYEEEAKFVKDYINENMFDEKTGYYYDLQISEDGKKKKLLTNRGMGPEGWIPLWAEAALPSRAKRVMQNMLCKTKFNTVMPFGTAALDNPSFQPEAYWRGPVWMDQAYFGVQGLMNYGYKEEAVELASKLINSGEGLIGEGTIRENYNPLTGKGLDATNFSWSSAVYLLMYQDILAGNVSFM